MGAASTRLSELAKRLAAMGHTVQVITALPNYPTGRIFPGYRGKIRMVEEMEGIRVIRTWIYPSTSSRTLPRLFNYLSFVLTSILLGWWGLGRQDVILCESPPLFLVPAGLVIGRITRARMIMNASDIWPDLVVRLGYPLGWLSLKLMHFLERFGYQCSDVVAVTNPGAMEQIEKRFPRVETTVISNGADLDLFRPLLRSQAVRTSLGAGPETFLVGYCGLHGLAQGLEVVVEAAARLRDHPRIRLVMVGDGPTKEGLMARTRQLELDNLRFEECKPRADIPAILASCDASLIPLAAELPGTMPSKVYEALASGVPVVVTRGCEAETLVDQFHVGRAFAPLDAKDLAAVLIDLADRPEAWARMRRNGIELAARFDRKVIAARTEAIFQAVAAGRPLPKVSW